MADDGAVLELALPWPPSVNDFKVPVPGRKGVYFLTKRAKQFRVDVGWLTAGARRFGAVPIEMRLLLCPPHARAYDADNFVKATWDALQAAEIFDDDTQVQKYTVMKGAIVPDGFVLVKLWPYRK